MATTREDCDCTCHGEGEAPSCSCCPDSGGWAETCEGHAHTTGGHSECRPGRCREQERDDAQREHDAERRGAW